MSEMKSNPSKVIKNIQESFQATHWYYCYYRDYLYKFKIHTSVHSYIQHTHSVRCVLYVAACFTK